jgi:hypothetical protein
MEDEVMAKCFLFGGKRVVSALCALSASLLLMTGCDEAAKNVPQRGSDDVDPKHDNLPVNPMPVDSIGTKIDVPPPVVVGGGAWDTIELMVRTDPAEPENEHFLDDWRFQIFTIDDQARPTSPTFYGETGPDGNALIGLPSHMFALPLVVTAYNDVFAPPFNEDDDYAATNDANYGDHYGQCRLFEIFIPSYCHDKAVWLLGPFEDKLWRFYKEAAKRRAESWNPSQVDCGTWLANMQLLILSDRVADELNDLSDSYDHRFSEEALILALQENQHLLTPTRPPICMAERRHNGGGMERGDIIEDDDEGDHDTYVDIDDYDYPFRSEVEVYPDDDPVLINIDNGLAKFILSDDDWDDATLSVNGTLFVSDTSYYLDDQDFMGTIHDDIDIRPNMDVSVYNTRLGNGYPLDADDFDDAAALTTIIEFTNKNDDEQDVLTGTGVTITNLFSNGQTDVYLTSDGDSVVDDNDTWAIFYEDDDGGLVNTGDAPVEGAVASEANDVRRHHCNQKVIAVELIGHRQEDFRDVLHMTYNQASEDLFIGLRADYELNEEEVDGERAFLAYTISVWDGSSHDGRRNVRRDISNCYEASDVWARQFFVTQDFDIRKDECCFDEGCEIEDVICPLEAAEFAVRSQCFSNSRSNQRWRTDDAGYWSMNTDHGVPGDVIVNAGWLAPRLDYEIYVQKFDEAVFKGPRTIRTSDDVGQLMVELPTLVEGDRILIKSEDNCCDDYDLVIPCVPEFTGFAGAPGIPYVPVTLGPPVPAVPVPVP